MLRRFPRRLSPQRIATALCALALVGTAPFALAAPQKPAAKTATRQTTEAPRYATRADAMQAADDIAARRDLDPAWVRNAIGEARLLRNIPRLVLPAPKGMQKNWRVYRSRFIDEVRIAAGVAFWQQHAEALVRAEREFGVPAEMIVGIIGVETVYGRQMGNFRVIDALATLAFDFPRAHPRSAEREAFFRGELEQLLTLAHRSGNDPLAYRGSYAGAMGWPQFMPSSWARHAVDFDGDGRIDLFNSPVDAIGSVANYFKAYGWQTGMPTHYAVQLQSNPAQMDTLLAPDILPTFSTARFAEQGALLDDAGRLHEGPLALVELQNGSDAPQFVAGTQNFYVVTRYNWSSYYAMAVIELGKAVAAVRGR